MNSESLSYSVVAMQESHFHITGEIHNSPENGMPWFLHRVGPNKLVSKINEIHRVDHITAPIAYKVMEDHLHNFQMSKDIFDLVPECLHVDMWTLAFWKHLEGKTSGVSTMSLAQKCARESGHLREGELPMALLPPDAFGSSILDCATLQLTAILYLNELEAHDEVAV